MLAFGCWCLWCCVVSEEPVEKKVKAELPNGAGDVAAPPPPDNMYSYPPPPPAPVNNWGAYPVSYLSFSSHGSCAQGWLHQVARACVCVVRGKLGTLLCPATWSLLLHFSPVCTHFIQALFWEANETLALPCCAAFSLVDPQVLSLQILVQEC
jgi:hypothetical protein